MIKILPIKNWIDGWINKIEDRSIPRGSFSDGLNWLLQGDKVELRRGSKILGTEITGTGSINGIHTAYAPNGDEILMRAYTTKLLYSTDGGVNWTEIGTDILVNEDVSFANYASISGTQVWICSPNQTKLIKIMTANMDSYTDVYNSAINFLGHIKIIKNRMWLWGRLQSPSTIYLSFIDSLKNTTVTAEVIATGTGATTYTGTLAFKAAGARRTCFAISIVNVSGTVETFTDNRDGTLTGSLGGTGTINYTSGAFSVTFNSAVASGNITATYQWEDSADDGIADFTYSGTRVAGEGTFFLQGTGGDAKNIYTYNDTQYVKHEKNWWVIKLTVDDTDAVNEIWRQNLGSNSLRGAIDTGDGIYLIDDANTSDTKIRLMQYSDANDQVVPQSISDTLNLSGYVFDKACAYKWGDYVLFSCKYGNSTYNNRVLIYNLLYKKWEVPQNYNVSDFTTYSGALIAGDSVSKNAWELFSGYDDDDADINNNLILNLDDLGEENLKKLKKLRIQGEIQTNQAYKIYGAVDNGGYVELGTISGTDTQVDKASSTTIGSSVLGKKEIGGGTIITAYNYDKTINISDKLSKFQKIKLKFEATGIGYVSISELQYYDIRSKELKPPQKYI